jgi:DNA-binding transcriptional ArsR family regulator
VEAFDILGDPVRRRILELLAGGESAAGDVVTAIQAEFGLTQPAVSRQLRVLRESGFASVRAEGTRRIYALNGEALGDAAGWLADLHGQWSQRLDALETELARGRRKPNGAKPNGAKPNGAKPNGASPRGSKRSTKPNSGKPHKRPRSTRHA